MILLVGVCLVDAGSAVGGDDAVKDAVPAVPVGVQDDDACAVIHFLQVDDVPVVGGLAARCPAQLAGEAFVAHGLGLAFAPFDDGDGLVEG